MSEPERPPIRVVLVDDSELVRRGVKSVLAQETSPALLVVGEAGTVADAVAICRTLRPDIVLMDIRLPDGSGFEACRHLLVVNDQVRVIILTAFANDTYVYEAVTSGAHGYLMKEIDARSLVQAIHDVVAGRSILDPEATSRVLRLLRSGSASTESSADLSQLSHQERRVLALVADGLTNKQVGDQLGLSENTVKNYLVNVFEKLQVKRRAQAAALFVQHAQAGKDQAGLV